MLEQLEKIIPNLKELVTNDKEVREAFQKIQMDILNLFKMIQARQKLVNN